MGSEHFTQIGLQGEEQLVPDHRTNLRMAEVAKLVKDCDLWISCDSFLQHLAHHVRKPGIVIWSASDPRIFGYPYNVNILKDVRTLRRNQFDMWEAESYKEDAFPEPEQVYEVMRTWLDKEMN